MRLVPGDIIMMKFMNFDRSIGGERLERPCLVIAVESGTYSRTSVPYVRLLDPEKMRVIIVHPSYGKFRINDP